MTVTTKRVRKKFVTVFPDILGNELPRATDVMMHRFLMESRNASAAAAIAAVKAKDSGARSTMAPPKDITTNAQWATSSSWLRIRLSVSPLMQQRPCSGSGRDANTIIS
mmetsp:Transcript_23656/g.48634  ORF Transcript_23656/g.48634 Transcript_23656/m.48634 type:complete len:109 (-) Transcript_23656:433-759(-)